MSADGYSSLKAPDITGKHEKFIGSRSASYSVVGLQLYAIHCMARVKWSERQRGKQNNNQGRLNDKSKMNRRANDAKPNIIIPAENILFTPFVSCKIIMNADVSRLYCK